MARNRFLVAFVMFGIVAIGVLLAQGGLHRASGPIVLAEPPDSNPPHGDLVQLQQEGDPFSRESAVLEPRGVEVESDVSSIKRPREKQGRIRDAKSCLHDPFYNPNGVRVEGDDLLALQLVIDGLNKELFAIETKKQTAIDALIEQKFREGQWQPGDGTARTTFPSNRIYTVDRVTVGDNSHGSRVAFVNAGESPEIDALVSSFDDSMTLAQDTVRQTVLNMAH